MKKFLERICSSQFIRFGLIGVLNTVIGTAVMFFAYNVMHLGYWASSALNYIVGSIFSYFANKYFTFRQKEKSFREILRFIMNIAACYFIAYGLSVPLVKWIMDASSKEIPKSIYEQIAMLVGMVIFVILNFIGQKLVVFKSGAEE